MVEDNEDARDIFRLVLEHFGAHVTTEVNAKRGLRALRGMVPNIVVADIQLGDETAMWLLREARTFQNNVPFIAVSALDFDQNSVREHGFAAYLRKPVDHDRLVDTILAVTRKAA